MIEYFPALYAPGALGLGLGRLCGLSPFASLLLGRAFMLLAFAGLGFMALRLARCGHALLFAVLTPSPDGGEGVGRPGLAPEF